MSNVFKEKDKSTPRLKRNNFDLSHFNNLTMRIGRIYPNLCMEVIPGDSISIDTSMGLNLMPMVYPVQTPLYVNQYFFYCRNRALYNRWMDFINKTKDGLVPPYLKLEEGSEQASKILQTGSLGDYFNIPTINDSVAEQYPVYLVSFTNQFLSLCRNDSTVVDSSVKRFFFSLNYSEFHDILDSNFNLLSSNWLYPITGNSDSSHVGLFGFDALLDLLNSSVSSSSDYVLWLNELSSSGFSSPSPVATRLVNDSSTGFSSYFFPLGYDQGNQITRYGFSHYDNPGLNPNLQSWFSGNFFTRYTHQASTISMPFILNASGLRLAPLEWDESHSVIGQVPFYIEDYDSFVPYLDDDSNQFSIAFVDFDGKVYDEIFGRIKFRLSSESSSSSGPVFLSAHLIVDNFNTSQRLSSASFDYDKFVFPVVNFYSKGFENVNCRPTNILALNGFLPVSSTLHHSPFTSKLDGTKPAIPISALPFRAYESIFNAYFRNQQNDPLIINGEPEYNQYVRNLEGGEDTEIYDFYNRYWEPDFLTSALPSPQQGVAPLVGVTGNGLFTFEDPDTGDQYQAQAVVGDDGHTLTGIDVHSPDMPVGTLRALMSYVQHGLSINDFRNVNSLQRWLETNLRCGYKYRDLMRAHHGVNIRFDELNMPEYIGGFSEVVQINKVVNSDSQGSRPLGEFAGLGSAFANSRHSSRCYCDEHGFIIGVCVVSPVPVYSQNLPKFFFKNDPLDYYSHEFAKIGLQPISYNEVTPINRYNESLSDSSKSVHDTFGYQRAWYDYMSMTDEAHGDFRGNLRDYIMYRLFGSSPLLGKDFLTVKQSDMNNVFAETGDNDKIVGQFHFAITRKSQILRHVTPSLE